MAQTYDLTEGRVTKQILNFFFPMLMTNMLQQVYNFADTVVVGKGLGDNALASVGNMSSLTFLIFGFSMGLAGGFAVSIAQSFGAKDYAKMRKAVASSIKLALYIALILTVLSLTMLKPVLILLQTDEAILGGSLVYGYIIFGGLITTIAYNVCANILRALGDSKTSFYAIIASSVINVGLNCLFIFVFKTGVEGVAIATIIAQIVSVLICLRKLTHIDILKLKRGDFATDMRMYLELFKNGLPMAIMNSITAVGCMVVQYFVNGMGVACTSAYSTCSKYLNLFMQPACTAGFAMSSFTSQNLGAKKYGRIREGLKVCLLIAIITYVVFGSVMVFFPGMLARTMLNGALPISFAVQTLPICGIMIFTVDIMFVLRSGCQGMGKPLFPMISGIAEMVMRIGVIMLLSASLGYVATAYAEISAWMSALIINGLAFFINLNKLQKRDNTEVSE